MPVNFNWLKIKLICQKAGLKDHFNTQKTTDSERALAFFQQSTTRKGDFRAIPDLVDLLNENGGLDENIKFDYEEGELVEMVYNAPENEPLPL